VTHRALDPEKTMKTSGLALLAILLSSVLPSSAQTPLGSGFTYQGRLTDAGSPATGSYDFRFTLFDAGSGGNPVGTPLAVDAVAVNQGLFTVTLDFGASAFQGQARWLAIEVRLTGGGGYTPLGPRQPLTPAPHSVFSSFTDPANLTSLNASNLTSGTLPSARLSGNYSLALNLSNPGNAVAGAFSGNGAALTSLNASSLASGTVPSGVVAGTYSNALTLSSPANAFTGDGSGLTNLNAQPRYVRTVVVGPLGTPAQNGAALLAALAGITTASAANPWLLKIEPGIYDVGATPFLMKPFVDVEGSGQLATKITGVGSASNGVGTVQAVSNSELRFLAIENTGGAPYAKPLFVDAAAPRISHVAVRGFGGSVESQGFFAQNGAAATVTDLSVSVSATGTANSFGVLNIAGSTSVFFNLNVNCDGGATSRAIASYTGATPTLRNVFAVAFGATNENWGISNSDASATLENVVGVATGAATNNIGCVNAGAAAFPIWHHADCRGNGASNVNWGVLSNFGSQPSFLDISASAYGGLYAHAVENNGAGPGLSISGGHAVAGGGSNDSAGLYTLGSSPRIVDFEAYASATGGSTAFGIESGAASPTLIHVTAVAAGETGLVAGISNGTGSPVIEHGTTSASGGSASYGVLNLNGASPTLTDISASAATAGNFVCGVATFNASVSLRNVTATASSSAAGSTSAGVFNSESTASLVNVTATASGSGTAIGIADTGSATPSTVTIDRSTASGSSNSVTNLLGTTHIAHSQLVGAAATAAGATTTCLTSYNGNYQAVNALCQ
jgi:hypothetical protein